MGNFSSLVFLDKQSLSPPRSLSLTHSHTRRHVNLSLSQHARGSPHDADVVSGGMERCEDAEGPVTQSLPNLITDCFMQTVEGQALGKGQMGEPWLWLTLLCNVQWRVKKKKACNVFLLNFLVKVPCH